MPKTVTVDLEDLHRVWLLACSGLARAGDFAHELVWFNQYAESTDRINKAIRETQHAQE